MEDALWREWIHVKFVLLIVLLHVPWYNSNFAHQGEGDNMMGAMEHLIYAAHVDIVIAGHVHAYERSVWVLADPLT